MNDHGLDSRYFKEKLAQLVRDADKYTPQEMSNALSRLKEVADQQQWELTMHKMGAA